MHYKQIIYACVSMSSLRTKENKELWQLLAFIRLMSTVELIQILHFTPVYIYTVSICYCFEQSAEENQPMLQKAFEKYLHFLVCFVVWHLSSSMGFVQLPNETAELQRLESEGWSCTLGLIYTTLPCTILAMQKEKDGGKSCPYSQPGLKAAFKAHQHLNE